MENYQLNKPVLFLVFNRPDVTTKVFAAIREARPPRLYAAADGPRESYPDDEFKCVEVRNLITENIDWPCELHTLFRDENQGCRDAVSSAITWFFEQEESGIILEDDCLPHPDFFRFCDELLDYYKDNEKVMHISGSNFNFGKWYDNADYYFSKYAMIWGWATWRRAWKLYDRDLDSFDEFAKNEAVNIIPDVRERERFLEIFQHVRNQDSGFNTWDFQWFYSVMRHRGVAVQPNINFVSNIGFKNDPTHKINTPALAELPIVGMAEKLQHPAKIATNIEADIFAFRLYKLPLISRIKRFIINFIFPTS
jgi:hypothetical protein